MLIIKRRNEASVLPIITHRNHIAGLFLLLVKDPYRIPDAGAVDVGVPGGHLKTRIPHITLAIMVGTPLHAPAMTRNCGAGNGKQLSCTGR